MAFIPIDAKADVQGSKKGKLTPAQHAQLNAWSLASKTGILDCLDRCEAENTIYTATNNEAVVVFKKGYIVVCGRLVECEQGTQVTIRTHPTANTFGRIVLRYDLSASQGQEFEVVTTSAALRQQDLNENPLTGLYEFELYRYTATPTSVTLAERTSSYIPDIGGKLAQFEASLKDEGKPLHGYDDTKGTIEERLTRLGFKSGAIKFVDNTYGSENNTNTMSNGVFRSGNYVICHLNVNFAFVPGFPIINEKILELPENFRPKENVWVTAFAKTYGNYQYKAFFIEIDSKTGYGYHRSGAGNIDYNQWINYEMQFGFEAPPIETKE